MMDGHILNLIHRINRITIKIVTGFSLVLLSVLTIATMGGVFFRYVLKSPVVWLYEFTILVFAWTIFSGVVLAYSRNENIHLTFIMNALRAKGQFVLALIVDTINMIFIGMVIYFGFKLVKGTAPQTYQTIPVSLGWFYASFPVMGIPMIITLIDRAVSRFENIKSGAE